MCTYVYAPEYLTDPIYTYHVKAFISLAYFLPLTVTLTLTLSLRLTLTLHLTLNLSLRLTLTLVRITSP